MAVFDHHRVIEHGHVRHAAMAMTVVEIGAEYRVLLRGRHRAALLSDDVGVACENLAEISRGTEFVGDHPHRDAGAALVAGGAIGDRLAAPETALGGEGGGGAGLLAHQMREHPALVAGPAV